MEEKQYRYIVKIIYITDMRPQTRLYLIYNKEDLKTPTDVLLGHRSPIDDVHDWFSAKGISSDQYRPAAPEFKPRSTVVNLIDQATTIS